MLIATRCVGVGVGAGAGAGVRVRVRVRVRVHVRVCVGEGEGSHLLSCTLALYQDLGSYGLSVYLTDRQTVTDRYKIDQDRQWLTNTRLTTVFLSLSLFLLVYLVFGL